MKILKLRALNINSLKGKTEIDFTKFADNNSIFAITGVTGSGKSTILDIICCALYAKTDRLNNPHDLMTKGCGESFCEVEFEITGVKYMSSWSIRRAHNKSDGNLQSPKMDISTLKDKKIICTGVQEVPHFIESISGLDFNKFTKSMMLVQGGFDAFLKASEKDRSQLLEKITGTVIYSDISKKVFEKHKEIKLDLKAKKDVLDNFDISSKDILNLKNAEKDSSQKKKLDIDREIKDIQDSIQKEIKIESLRENILKIKGSISSKEIDIKILESKYNDSKVFMQNISKNIDREIDYLSKNVIDKSLIENINLIGENLENYKEQYSLKDLIENKLGIDKESYNKLFDKKRAILKDVDNLETKFSKIELTYQKSIVEVKDDGLQEPIFREKILKLEIFLQNKDRLKELKENTKDSKKRKKDLIREILEIEGVILNLKDDISTLREHKEKLLLIQKYEEDRKNLQSGEACFLCGSKKHPYIKHKESIPKDKISSKILKKEHSLLMQESSLKDLEIKLTIVDEVLDRNSLEREKINEDIKISNIKGKRKDIENNLKVIKSELSKIIKRRETRESLIKDREELNTLLQEKKGELSSLDKRIIKIEESIKTLKKQKDNNINERDKLEKILISQWKLFGLIFDTSSYSSQYQELVKRKDKFIKVQKSLDKFRVDEQKIKLKESELLAKLETIKKEIDELKRNLSEIKVEDSLVNINELKEKFKEKRYESDKLQKLIGKLEEQLDRDREKRVEYKEKIDELAKEKESFKVCQKIDSLIGSSNGAKFAKFAQGITLDQLIELANGYLNILTKRYILVRPQAENKRELLEIYITDTFQADVIRPVSTLSGGESFIVSLSLALGLSELASQKISIDSLFLDEGFGTLDSENLEMAINALNNLQSSGKMVGVISHVEALKERIPTQIQVIANGDGTSEVFVNV